MTTTKNTNPWCRYLHSWHVSMGMQEFLCVPAPSFCWANCQAVKMCLHTGLFVFVEAVEREVKEACRFGCIYSGECVIHTGPTPIPHLLKNHGKRGPQATDRRAQRALRSEACGHRLFHVCQLDMVVLLGLRSCMREIVFPCRPQTVTLPWVRGVNRTSTGCYKQEPLSKKWGSLHSWGLARPVFSLDSQAKTSCFFFKWCHCQLVCQNWNLTWNGLSKVVLIGLGSLNKYIIM